jgi:outer membrane protein OmpA-like peptidoglycan-associated protein
MPFERLVAEAPGEHILEDSMIVEGKTRARRPLILGMLAFLSAVLISASAFAQQSDSFPKYDLFVGYQYINPGVTVPAPFGDPSSPGSFKVPGMAKGFGSAFTYNVDKNWGIEFDLGHNWGSGNYETTGSVGPRFMWRTEDFAAFIHGLVSENRFAVSGLGNGKNGIGLILGGGIDLPITKHFSYRLFEADYVWSRHNYADFVSASFPNLRRPGMEGARLRTGVVFNWGGAEPVTPAAACTVQPSEVLVGEPITASVTASNFNPKHTVTYVWSGNGGQVTGKDTSATIDTTNATPGSYAVTAHVTDSRAKTNNVASCTANYTIKPLPPKNPPTVSISANPTDLVTGGSVALTATCSSPDNASVSVANWTATGGTISGSGNSATLSTSGAPAGPITINATCTDARGLTAQASTQVTIENPPPPPVDKALEARLALHSVYFPTNIPTVKNPDASMVPSQQQTLTNLATDFKKYLEAKPDAHLVLGGHADIRGGVEFNQKLSERRVARVKSFLVGQGVPEADIETKAFGKERNLTLEEVKASVDGDTELTPGERKRAMARINVIKLASNRRVDVTLHTGEGEVEKSVRRFPFNASDAMSLIGGREADMKPAAKKPMAKKPMARKPMAKKPAAKQ